MIVYGRPKSPLGQTEKNSVRANVFRVTPESGHRSIQSACLKGAKRRHRFGHLGAISSRIRSCIRCGHLLNERSKSNDEFGCSLTVASDKIERLPDFFQIWRFSAQPV